ncbi:MAG: ABC transporter permease, partial [Lachnospiraceae bacterium]|nr:ABC transporter permease [Lachnospiraceae bacterium]
LRSCGEHPQAAASVGINVFRMRYLGTMISGALAGLGGYAYIATVANGTAESSVGGMGFLALAIMIFGNWKPLGIALGAVLFGFLKCIGPVASSVDFLKSLGLEMYFYNIIPYVVVLIVLALTAKKSGCPKAEGIPYDKGMR